MGKLKIVSLKYEGEKYFYQNDKFKSGLNVLVGNNGNGKSTFTYLIVYALGLNVSWFNEDTRQPLQEILEDKDNYVELKIEIDKDKYILKRKINGNIISVFSEETQQFKNFSIIRKGYFYVSVKK